MFGSIRIIEDDKMVDVIEDWSGVRAPSRAARRRRQGHRQNIKFFGTSKKEAVSIDGGRTMIMHPAMAHALRLEVKARIDSTTESVLLRGWQGY